MFFVDDYRFHSVLPFSVYFNCSFVLISYVFCNLLSDVDHISVYSTLWMLLVPLMSLCFFSGALVSRQLLLLVDLFHFTVAVLDSFHVSCTVLLSLQFDIKNIFS